MLPTVYYYILIFVLGLAVGSFLNVCIYRIPKGEDIVREPSHCMTCGHRLTWYDNIPLVSYLALKGCCRYCGARISPQYPLVEAANAILWTLTFAFCGPSLVTLIYCGVISALLVLSVIDFRTYEIPFGINIFIMILAVIAVAFDGKSLVSHLVGMLVVSLPMELLVLASHGRAMGGGDVKLFFASGLLLGMSHIILAFILSCLFASVVHLIRMRVTGAEHLLAMGPYISMAILVTIWFGNSITGWYLSLF